MQPYCGYETYDFEVPTGTVGDVFERYLVRLAEMRQSIRIVDQALRRMPEGPVVLDDPRFTPPPKEDVYENIEALIRQFKLMSTGFKAPLGDVYASVEATKGELGYYLVSDGSEKPWRFRVRPPCFYGMGAVERMVKGYAVADLVAIFGMVNMIGGECDR